MRSERLAEVRQKVANYKRFRELTDEWVDLMVELEQQGTGATKAVGRWDSSYNLPSEVNLLQQIVLHAADGGG